jgi:hypothetical protein
MALQNKPFFEFFHAYGNHGNLICELGAARDLASREQ